MDRLDEIVKKISLNKGVEEDDVRGMVVDFFTQVREVMGQEELCKILIHNFVSFVPNKGRMKRSLGMCEHMIKTGRSNERIEELKRTIENSINKEYKRKNK